MFEPLEVEQDDKYKRFGKRSFVFVCMLLLLFFVLAARLFALQILNSETYASISSRNQLRIVSQPAKRGDIYVVVTHRPAENSFDVVNLVAGYVYKKDAEIVIKIGNQTFKNFFASQDKAWTITANDDKALVTAMKRGERMIVNGVSSRGTKTKDTYSLKGFMRAYKAISAKCGKK